jgi:hypothetical protein
VLGLVFLTCLKTYADQYASRRTISYFKRVTQSISLSNIQTFSFFEEKARPEAVETCRNQSRKTGHGVLPDRSLLIDARDVDLEAANEHLVELTGIEPVTPCLQSRCSPS